mgnify:CR=1 FL=1
MQINVDPFYVEIKTKIFHFFIKQYVLTIFIISFS